MPANIKSYLQLMRFNKPIGTMLLLWPMLMACRLAGASTKVQIIFTLGVIVMRAAGCVINDYADRNIDKYVSRTKMRPITCGDVSTKGALRLFACLIGVALVLALQLNLYTIGLSVIAVLLAISYPFMKRITNYPQVVLGIAFAWSIPMLFAQTHNALPTQAWVLFVSTVFWVIAYDTQYAMVDKEDDIQIGVKSTAIAFARFDRYIIFALQLFAVFGYLSVGANPDAGLGCLCLMFYQQWLMKDREPKKCMKAFLTNNYFGLIVYLGFL